MNRLSSTYHGYSSYPAPITSLNLVLWSQFTGLDILFPIISLYQMYLIILIVITSFLIGKIYNKWVALLMPISLLASFGIIRLFIGTVVSNLLAFTFINVIYYCVYKYQTTKNNKILLFVGGLDKAHYFKGLEVLMNALKFINNTRLLVLGDGNLKDYYISLIDKLEIKNRVVFVGKVSDEELVKYYNICDIFILPSIDKTEAFGLVLLEAIACGKSVITSVLPGVRTVVRNNVDCLLVTPGDVNDLFKKIKYLLEKDNLRKKFGVKGGKRVNQFYFWPFIIKNLENIYISVMSI